MDDESQESEETTTPTEEKKSFKDILSENPEYQKAMNDIIEKRLNRRKNEINPKYSELETILEAGLGVNNIDEATKKLKDFYTEQGVKIPEKAKIS